MNLPDPDSREWRDRMDDALATGNLGAMADLLLAGIAKPKAPEPMAKSDGALSREGR